MSRENPCIGCELFYAYGWRGRRRNGFHGDVYYVVHTTLLSILYINYQLAALIIIIY